MSDQEPITILVVEDDLDFLDMLSEMLRHEGYEVFAAENGENALEIAQERAFDLVVTDVKLGGIDGLDTLAKLKHGNSELQSLVITGYATEADSVRAISLGVGNYLRKPFTLPDFMRAVNQLAEEIHRERKMARFLRSVRVTSLWGLETVLQNSDRQALIEAAREAESKASHRGLSEQAGFHIRLAVLAGGVKAHGLTSTVPFLLDILPDETGWILEGLKPEAETQSDEIKLAREALEGLVDLEGAFLDDAVEPAPDAPESQPGKANLLALARAFEVSGDVSAASLTLERMEQQNKEVSVQALLLKARLLQTRGEYQEAEQHLQRAETLAQGLYQQSRVKLDGGLLLSAMNKKEPAREWIEAAAAGFEELSNSVQLAQARLALGAVSGDVECYRAEDLSRLLSPGSLEILLGSAHWLYPYALSLPSTELVERALLRLTRDLPTAVGATLQGDFKEEYKLRALELVGQTGIVGYEDLLQELMLDGSSKVRRTAQNLLTDSTSITVAPVLRLYSMGTVATWVGDRRIPDKGWVGRKPSYLLYFLAQHQDRFLSPDLLIETFWPDSARSKKNLNQTLFVLRDTLSSPDWPESLDYIFRTREQVGLNPEQTVWFDANVIQDNLKQANRLLQEDRSTEAADLLQQALDLDRGDYLEVCYDDWVMSFRESLRLQLSEGLSSLAEVRLGQGRFDEAVTVCQHLLEKDGFDEKARKYLFQAQIDSGQPLEVVRGFEALEQKMRLELDLDPSMELVKLYHVAKLKL